MLAAQIICFALIGLVGGTVGPRIARAKHRKRAMIVSAALGVILVVIYLTVVSVAGFYAFATNVNLWVYLWAGIAFAAVQVVWNAVVFGVAVPPMLRVLARQRRQLHSATTRDVGQKP